MANAAVIRRSLFRRWWFWILVVLLISYAALVVIRVFALEEERKTQEAVSHIHADRLTLDDVMGKDLPPAPDPALAVATIEGVDVNKNGIRDDVELAIFKKYPNSARIRAAELQYAKALQMYFSRTTNTATLIAVIEKEYRGSFCIGDALLNPKESASDETWSKFFRQITLLEKEVDDWILNTTERQQKHDEILKKYMSSNSVPNGPYCDIDMASLGI